ncbi:succinate--hydroxymethylglutarate CoA-transferase isoform X2 [Hydra vulgaris]|uniref:Succinate--hydroxymethylglutarate CoA-transferase isoform X2 n=1 Tax=Hydra vulgaris TaxID=6087 RepID=A0ABM4BEW6_HYDVU
MRFKFKNFDCLLKKNSFKIFKRCNSDKNQQVVPNEQSLKLLNGIRVCDMTRVLAGPYCTMILGDMGAEVIKIERPGIGDDTRHFGPPYVGGESCYYLAVNRNKKSIAVDFHTKEGVEIIQELAKTSDVFIENYICGKLDAVGLGYETLKALNPKLIYCSITGYGSRGLLSDIVKPGYDLVASSIGGLNAVTGPENGEPCRVGVAVTDIMTGMYAHGAILAALYQREITKLGTKIDTSLLQTQVAVMSHIGSDFLNAGVKAPRYGTGHRAIVPYQAFEAEDGQLFVIGVANDNLFQKFCLAMDLSLLLNDERFKSNKYRVIHRNELIPIISEKIKTKPADYWITALENAGVPCGSINDIEQVFKIPQVKELDLIQELLHPTAGLIKICGPAVDFNGKSILQTPLHPPLLGEHTKHVLSEILHYDDGKINDFLGKNVISTLN